MFGRRYSRDYYINILYLTSENRGVVLDHYPIKYTPAIVIKNGENISFNYIRNWQNPGLDLSQLLAQWQEVYNSCYESIGIVERRNGKN